MPLREGRRRQRRPDKVEEEWRNIGLHAFLEFANGDLRRIEPTRVRTLLSQVADATIYGGGPIRPPVEFPKWLLQGKRRPTRPRATPVAPPTTQRETLALQAILRDDLLARMFP